MPQNGPFSGPPGPPWSSGRSEEQYSEPSDPWGDHAVPDDPVWGAGPAAIPQQPMSYQGWGTPPPAPPRRNTPMVALVVALSVLMVAGLGAALWLLNDRKQQPASVQAPASAAADPGVAPAGSEDARFNVKVGDCVVNEGSDDDPAMRTTACTSGTYEVLKRVEGKTTGERDAESKCAKVAGYTKWYFYDSSLDDLDFVLCLKEHKAL
jgi:hypothetical protein